MRFCKGIKINQFWSELYTVIRELYDIHDDSVIQSIFTSHVVSNFDDAVKGDVEHLQLSGNVKLENILELAESKMENNHLQSFGSYQQHQQNTLYLQNHPHSSNLISNFNPSNQYIGNQYDGFPSSNLNNNQFISTKMATNQNWKLSEIKNIMKLLLQREISRDQNSTSNAPSPTCNICSKKGHMAKNCFTTKTCIKCNTKGHMAKFCKNNLKVQTCCGETFEQNVVMLYDPDSEYSIISKSMYGKLSVKPPLLPLKRCGVGIHNSKFQFHGVICVNL